MSFENWDLLVKKYEPDLDSLYETSDGKKYRFIGLIHGSDDYYYGMFSEGGKFLMCSCVGSIEAHGFRKVDRTA
jgi:hypothetical protein